MQQDRATKVMNSRHSRHSRDNGRWAALLLIGGLLFSAVASAAGPLESRLEMRMVTIDKVSGKEVLSEIANKDAEISPGQMIEYHLIYSNVGKGALGSLVVNGPIPKDTTYVADSARTKVAHKQVVSIDDGKLYEAEPVKRVEKNAEGKMVEVIIGPEAYTHIRWNTQQQFPAGKEWDFYYRVTID